MRLLRRCASRNSRREKNACNGRHKEAPAVTTKWKELAIAGRLKDPSLKKIQD